MGAGSKQYYRYTKSPWVTTTLKEIWESPRAKGNLTSAEHIGILFAHARDERNILSSAPFVIRDLKRQNGRWRRGRHIHVYGEETGVAFHSHKLSRLSNIATATSRQFSENIPLRRHLENKQIAMVVYNSLRLAPGCL